MSLASAPLRSDPAALRAFAAGLQTELARTELEIAANAAEIHAQTLHIEKLKMQLAVLRRARFGRSSEKLESAIEQLELLIGQLETDQAQAESQAGADPTGRDPAKPRPRQPAVRRPLPAHLPRETVTHAPPCTCPGCGALTRVPIPAGLKAHSFGPRLAATLSYLVGCHRLSRRGAEANLTWLFARGITAFERVDLRDAAAVDAVLRRHRDADCVLHLAGQVAVTTSVADPRADFEANALGTLNLLEATRAVLARNGVATEVVYPRCCGMPQLEQGELAAVAKSARQVAALLGTWIDKGYDIVALVPSRMRKRHSPPPGTSENTRQSWLPRSAGAAGVPRRCR